MVIERVYKDEEPVVRLPILKNTSIVEIKRETIPALEDLMKILRREKPQLNLINDLALLYYRQQRYDEFLQLLEAAKADGFAMPNINYDGNDYDRGRTLDMLGCYYLTKYVRESDRQQKVKYHKVAMMEFTTVDNIVGLETTHLVARGMFVQLEGKKLANAASQFEYVITTNPHNMMALVGRAMYFLTTNKVKEALQLFRQIMQATKFNCSPDIRIGIGHCYLKQKQYDKALLAYERALELAPDSSTAKVGIATCLLNMKNKSKEEKRRALVLAADVYKRNRDNYVINIILADYYFYRRDYLSSESLCKHVIYNCDNERLRSEACFQMARLLHQKATGKELEIERTIQLAHSNGAVAVTAEDKAAIAVMDKEKVALYDKAFQFYYQATSLQRTDARPFYGLCQMYLRKDDLQQAEKTITHALELVPNDLDAMRILALIYLAPLPNQQQAGSSGAAAAQPGSIAAATSAAQLKLRDERHAKAVEFLRKVAEGKSNEAEAWVQYASTLEGKDTRAALMSYAKAKDLMDAEKVVVPPAVYNNIGCLHFGLNNFTEAQRLFKLALTEIEEVMEQRKIHTDKISAAGMPRFSDNNLTSSTDTIHFRALSLLVRYNLARSCEEVHDYERARQLYQLILEQHRTNIQSVLRLGVILRQCGQKVEAEQKFKDALEIEPNSAEPWAHLGNLHVKYREYGPAQKKFERVVTSEATRDDVYCLCALGNIFLSTFSSHFYQSRSLQGAKRERQTKAAQYAFKYFKIALQYDPQCFYAAHGLACLLAYRGFTHEAQHIFSRIRDDLVSNDYPDVIMNLAHIHVQLRQSEQALVLYDSLLRKFPDFSTDAEFLMYIARAHYVAGNYERALRMASRARMLDPTSERIMYDTAVVIRKGAKRVLVDPTNGVKRVARAKADIETAKRYFKLLGLVRHNAAAAAAKSTTSSAAAAEPDSSQHNLRAEREAKHCEDLLTQSDYYLRKATEHDEKENELRRAHEEVQQQQAREREEVEQKRREEEERRAEEQRLRRLDMIQKANYVREGLRIAQQQEEAGGGEDGGGGMGMRSKKRSRRTAEIDDNFIDDARAGGGRSDIEGAVRDEKDQLRRTEPSKKRSKHGLSNEARRKKVAARRRRAQQREDEDGGKRSKRSKRDRDHHGAAAGGKRHKKRGARYESDSDDLAPGVSKAYVSTSEESSSSEDEAARQKKDERFKAQIAALAASTAVPNAAAAAAAAAAGAGADADQLQQQQQPRKRATFLDSDAEDDDDDDDAEDADAGKGEKTKRRQQPSASSASGSSSSRDGSPLPQRRRHASNSPAAPPETGGGSPEPPPAPATEAAAAAAKLGSLFYENDDDEEGVQNEQAKNDAAAAAPSQNDSE